MLCEISKNITVLELPLGNQSIYVFDNVFDNPELIRRYAIENRDKFKKPPLGSYPGHVMPFEDATFGIRQLFSRHLCKQYNLSTDVWVHSSFAVVDMPPKDLQFQQRQPHTDPVPDFMNKFDTQYACVFYLFEEGKLGGTGFYMYKNNNTVKEWLRDKEKFMVENPECHDEFQGYMHKSNSFYEKLLTVGAEYNRMVVYPSNILHSGDIAHPELLSEDLETGRLTISSFILANKNNVYG